MLSPESKQKFIEQEVERSIEQRIEQGINQKNRDIVLAMHAKGFDLTVIADITSLPIDQVQALVAAANTKTVG